MLYSFSLGDRVLYRVTAIEVNVCIERDDQRARLRPVDTRTNTHTHSLDCHRV